MNPENLNYYDSVAYETDAIVKAAAGSVFSITGYNAHTSDVYVQLHDAASLPVDTSVPAVILKVPATSNFFYDFGEIGRFCENGIVVCGSTTGPTKTLSGAVLWINVQYK